MIKTLKLLTTIFVIFCISSSLYSAEKEAGYIDHEKRLLRAELVHLVALDQEGVLTNEKKQLIISTLFRIYLIDKEFALKSARILKGRKVLLKDVSDPLNWNELMDKGFEVVKLGPFIGLNRKYVVEARRIDWSVVKVEEKNMQLTYKKIIESFTDDLNSVNFSDPEFGIPVK